MSDKKSAIQLAARPWSDQQRKFLLLVWWQFHGVHDLLGC